MAHDLTRYRLQECPACGHEGLTLTQRGLGAEPGSLHADRWETTDVECPRGCRIDAANVGQDVEARRA